MSSSARRALVGLVPPAVTLLLALITPAAVRAQEFVPQWEPICPESSGDEPEIQSSCFPDPVYRAAPSISLAPHHPDYVSPSLCDGCFDAVVSYSTPAYTSLDHERSLTLMFANAQARPTGFVQVDAADQSTSDSPALMSLRLQHANGSWVTFINGSQEVFYNAGWGAVRLAAQWDASAMATGAYSYTAVVRS
jgi:hypothetical protein